MKQERRKLIPVDRISSLILLLVAFLYTVAGWRLPIWVKELPGPALTPRILAVALGVLALIIWFQAKPYSEDSKGGALWGRSVIILGFLLAYYVMLPLLGYTLCNFGLMLGVRRTFEPGSWRWDVIGSATIAAAAYFIFVQMFGLSFSEFFLWE
jgi:hypothetical protein